MRLRSRSIALFFVAGWVGCGAPADPATTTGPAWLGDEHVLADGQNATTMDCRSGICRHNENTDLVTWQGAIWLVHRTAISQKLGPNSALHIYKTTDGGKAFTQTALIAAPMIDGGRDIRDPHFYIVGAQLCIKTLTRLQVNLARDTGVDTVAMQSCTSDGTTWSPLVAVGPKGWSLWRIREHDGRYYSAAYADGDNQVALFSSMDGSTWVKGATVYDVSVDTPLETELVFLPSGTLLGLVRMDGLDTELLGDQGRLRTKVCRAEPPYQKFDCPSEITGQRFDGPLAVTWQGRLFMVARKHLSTGQRKRTALFELTGDPAKDPIGVREWGELPSAGDTSYAGGAFTDATHLLLTWYSGDLTVDEPWFLGMYDATDIRQGTVDLSQLQ